MSEPDTPLYRFLAPRYWLIWLGLAILRFTVMLPYRWEIPIGRSIGRIGMRAVPKRRKIAERNLALCFPELDADARADLLKRHFESLGMAFVEGALCWWASDRKIERLVEVDGLEHLESALARGKGVIMLTGHFAALDLGGRILTMKAPVCAMYRPHRNPLFDEIVRRGRARRARMTITKTDVRGLLRALRTNHAIWYAPDQSHRRRHSADVPFFSIPAPTNTATSTFAKMSGAAVVPFFPERLPDGQGYRLNIRPALAAFPTDDPAADALRTNRLLEDEIRRMPEQYLWVHRRFKRTDGGPDHYAGI